MRKHSNAYTTCKLQCRILDTVFGVKLGYQPTVKVGFEGARRGTNGVLRRESPQNPRGFIPYEGIS